MKRTTRSLCSRHSLPRRWSIGTVTVAAGICLGLQDRGNQVRHTCNSVFTHARLHWAQPNDSNVECRTSLLFSFKSFQTQIHGHPYPHTHSYHTCTRMHPHTYRQSFCHNSLPTVVIIFEKICIPSRSIILWNSLPSDIQSSTSLPKFKAVLRAYLKV